MLLIIEDTKKHQEAARAQFPEAKVVNYDEAYKLLRDARPGNFSGIITDLHFKVEANRKIPNAPFDPVYPKNCDAVGKELPFGLAFVLKAIELQTPVALYSQTDHHSDLVTGLLDMFGWPGRFPRKGSEKIDLVPDPKFFLIRDSSCVMAEDMHWDGEKIVLEPMPKDAPSYEDKVAWKAHWDKRVKDWRKAFQALSQPEGEE